MAEPFLVDAAVAAHYVSDKLGRPCTADVIRRWACDRALTRYQKRGKRTLYSLEEVHDVALTKRIYRRS